MTRAGLVIRQPASTQVMGVFHSTVSSMLFIFAVLGVVPRAIVLLGGVGVLVGSVSWRSSVELTADGILVRNGVRDRHFPLASIEGFSVDGKGASAMPSVAVHVRGVGRVPLWGTASLVMLTRNEAERQQIRMRLRNELDRLIDQ